MKKFIKGLFELLEWLFAGNPNEVGSLPGIVTILVMVMFFVVLVLFSPAWVPIWYLGRWCGYYEKQP